MMPKDHVFLGVSVANLGLGSAVSWMTIQIRVFQQPHGLAFWSNATKVTVTRKSR